MIRTVSIAAALLLATTIAGCASTPDTAGRAATEADPPEGELLIAAAASLTDVVEELAALLVAEHPGLEVSVNAAGSSTLAAQLLEGAPADVFAAADPVHVDTVVTAGRATDPRTFATNGLAIAVEPGNPLGITGLADLAADDVILVLAAPEVPAGRYAAAAFGSAEVTPQPASLEPDVRAALGKVVLGEADAAVVYRSDVVAAGGAVGRVEVAPEHDVPATYPVVVLDDAPNPAAARAFVDLLLSPVGADVLAAAGFGVP